MSWFENKNQRMEIESESEEVAPLAIVVLGCCYLLGNYDFFCRQSKSIKIDTPLLSYARVAPQTVVS